MVKNIVSALPEITGGPFSSVPREISDDKPTKVLRFFILRDLEFLVYKTSSFWVFFLCFLAMMN